MYDYFFILGLKTYTHIGMKLLLLILALVLLPGCKITSDMNGIVIINGVVLTMNKSHDAIENGAIVIKRQKHPDCPNCLN